MLVLSLFPGADLFGMAFEQEGFTVVRGPDIIFGGDIRKFRGIPDRFDGIIGGPPCQAFSIAVTGHQPRHLDMIPEFERVVKECNPKWWLMENVCGAYTIEGTKWSLPLDAHMFGSLQRRIRQYSSNLMLTPYLETVNSNDRCKDPSPTVLATEHKYSSNSTDRRRAGNSKGRRLTIEEINLLMGLPVDFQTPCFTVEYQHSVRGNGVPIQIGRALARAIRHCTAAVSSAGKCDHGIESSVGKV